VSPTRELEAASRSLVYWMRDDVSSDGEAARADGLPGRRGLPVPDLQTGSDHLLRRPGDGPAAGSGGDSGGVLARSVALRFPNLRELSGRERIDALCDHVSDTAIMRGELEELRLAAHVELRDVRARLATIPATSTRTKAAADESRRAVAPDLAAEESLALWLVDRCTEQINRFGGCDYEAASRSYTMLSS
jgi:hypothetical protein